MATSKNQRTSKKPSTPVWEQTKVKKIKETILVPASVAGAEDADTTQDGYGNILTYNGKEVVDRIYKFGKWYYKVKNI